MLTDEQMREYRASRALGSSPGSALAQVRAREVTLAYGLDAWAAWSDEPYEFEHGPYHVRVTVEPDDFPEPFGKFTNNWEPGAVEIERVIGPDAFTRDMYRYYVREGSTYEQDRKWLHEHGHSRHESHTLARAWEREDVRRALEWTAVCVRAEVYCAGTRVGFDVLGGIDVSDAYTALDREYVRSIAADVIAEALHDAEMTARAICAATNGDDA